MKMTIEERAQREIVRLANKWSKEYETALLEEFITWTNKNFFSPYKIVYKYETWELEKKEGEFD